MTDTLHLIHPDLRSLALPIGDLHEDPDNANTHDDLNLTTIADSFIEFGQRKPLVVRREGMIVEAGNGQLASLRAAGWTHLACVVCDDDETRAKAFALVDNQAGRLSKWNFEQLRANAEALLAADFNVQSLGWSSDDLADILSGRAEELAAQVGGANEEPEPPQPPSNEPDDSEELPIPEPPAEPITQPGDMWIMGEHRLICGSCRDPETVAKLLDGAKINVAFTSPPYASQRKYDESSGFKPIKPDEYVEWFEAVQANVREHLADDGSWFVNIKEHCEDGERHLYVKDLTIAHKRAWGWRFVDELCWQRNTVPGAFRVRFKNGWEPVFHYTIRPQIKFHPSSVAHQSEYAIKYDASRHFGNTQDGYGVEDASAKQAAEHNGLALPSNIIECSADQRGSGHSAPFPIALPARFILAYSDEGDVIFDPFNGSGTTIIAAERQRRRGYGCEISPKYCDVTVQRWEAETGREAIRVIA